MATTPSLEAGGDPGRAWIHLRAGRDRALRDGHPWVFSGAVAERRGPAHAALAEVVAADGTPLGVGFHASGSRIVVRLAAPPGTAIDRAWFGERLARADELRRAVLPPETDGYRLLNAEGDGVPGWTVDRFADVLVSQITAAGLEGLRDEAYAALAELHSERAILHRGDVAARRREGLALDDEWPLGAPRAEVWFRERGIALVAELAGGQKTGFYCDQRENRARVESLAGGRTLLDLFAHGGAFSLAALRGGAARATLVESATRLGELARRQLAANGWAEERATWVTEDVFRFLRGGGERFGVVVCDPPPLARRRADLERAARAYKDLNRLALGHVEPGGFFFTFSCSGAVDARLFRQILFAAAAEARVGLQLLGPLGAAPDHPVSVAHLEGEYLKGWWGRVVE